MAEAPRDEEAVERLLERRAAGIDDAAWLSDEAGRRLLSTIEADARRSRAPARAWWRPGIVVPLALAAAALAIFAPRWLGSAAPDVECRWFDPEGRELDGLLRGGAAEPPVLESILLELRAPPGEALAVRVFALGEDGRRVDLDAGRALELAPGSKRLVSFPLPPELGLELDVAVAAARDAASLVLPPDRPGISSDQRAQAVQAWAREVERAGGVALVRRINRASR